MEKLVNVHFYPMYCDARKMDAFGGFPGFDCLSFCYEQHLDENKYRTQMEW